MRHRPIPLTKLIIITFKLHACALHSKMASPEGEIRLEWSSFQANASEEFVKLRTSQDFADVTLVCEDEASFKAHRVVLGAGSSFFSSALSKDQMRGHPHPLIFLQGVKSSEQMASLLDFVYTGQAMVAQDSLQKFLDLAVSLGVKGLMTDTPLQCTVPSKSNYSTYYPGQEIKLRDVKEERPRTVAKNVTNEQNCSDVTRDAKEDELREDMILRDEDKLTCKVCDEEFTDEAVVSEHVKVHLESWKTSQECTKSVKTKHDERPRRSKVWGYFSKNDSMTATCNICGKDVKAKRGTTTNLHSHLQRKHGVEAESTDPSYNI